MFIGVQTAPDPSVGLETRLTSAEVVGQEITTLPPERAADNDTLVDVPLSWFGPRALSAAT